MGEREEGEGVSLWELRAWERDWKMVRPEQPWSRPWELVGSSARAGRWKGAAWSMYRRVWGCSP